MDATPQITIYDLARHVLRDHDNDTTKATDALTRRLLKDKALLRSVINRVVRDAVQVHVEAGMRSFRHAIVRGSLYDAQRMREGAEALARGVARSLLDFPLANGLKLGDATHEEVMEQAQRYASISADTGRKSRWLVLVGQSVPEGRRVRDVVSNGHAIELWQEAA